MSGPSEVRPVAVLGAGAWGTALAVHLGHERPVRLWARPEDEPEKLADCRENRTYLPGVPFSTGLSVRSGVDEALEGAGMVLLALPTQFLRAFLASRRGRNWPEGPVVLAMKGVETDTLCLPAEILSQEAGEAGMERAVVLSGPSFAAEVARGEPTAVVAAGPQTAGKAVQQVFSHRNLRVYTSPDLVGVQIGGGLKNVVALAAGILDGLGFGSNAMAALLTRALAEMTRLGVKMGARRETFQGLAGLGDLVLTCTGGLSRNRQAGQRLGRGEALASILAGRPTVVEGIETTRAARALALREGVEMPIVAQVHAVLFEGRAPGAAVEELLARPLRSEPEGENR